MEWSLKPYELQIKLQESYDSTNKVVIYIQLIA